MLLSGWRDLRKRWGRFGEWLPAAKRKEINTISQLDARRYLTARRLNPQGSGTSFEIYRCACSSTSCKIASIAPERTSSGWPGRPTARITDDGVALNYGAGQFCSSASISGVTAMTMAILIMTLAVYNPADDVTDEEKRMRIK